MINLKRSGDHLNIQKKNTLITKEKKEKEFVLVYVICVLDEYLDNPDEALEVICNLDQDKLNKGNKNIKGGGYRWLDGYISDVIPSKSC